MTCMGDKLLRIYRIAHAEQWTKGAYSVYGWNSKSATPECRPCPGYVFDDGHVEMPEFTFNYDYYFGFLSMDQIDAWFDDEEERQCMRNSNLVLYQVMVLERYVIRGTSQCAFHGAHATIVEHRQIPHLAYSEDQKTFKEFAEF